MKDLTEFREAINRIDRQMAALFEERMKVCADIAAWKAERGLPIKDAAREAEVIARNRQWIAEAAVEAHYVRFQQQLMETACAYEELVLAVQKLPETNLVFIGMPGCGKSTIGRLAAAFAHRPFISLDEEIIRETGMPIAEYFARYSEKGFREKEAEITARAAQENGCVIATGGGTILREENVRALAQNGVLLFLDRPLSDLTPTPDRPLSPDTASLARLYRERYDRYCQVADIRLQPGEDAEQNAAEAVMAAAAWQGR